MTGEMKILFAGIIARYPFGGVTWCSLMYLLGLRALGHEVFYIEDTGECVYDPVQNTRATDPTYGTSYIHNALEPFGLGDRWSFVNYDGGYHGRSAEEVRRYARTPISSSICRAAPGSGATSTRASRARSSSTPIRRSRSSRSRRPSRGTSSSSSASITCSPSDRTSARPRRRCRPARSRGTRPGSRSRSTTGAPTCQPRDRFTTVMTWQIESFTDVGGNKDQEFVKYIDLPSRTPQPFELAINGPQTLLREHGWETVDAMHVSRTPWEYRDFIHGSKAEFGVAKHTYVATRSGWFSDRTECYLASGRPALVQDTGWTTHLPSGEGCWRSRARRGARRRRSHQQRLRHARPPSRRNRPRTLRRARRPPEAAGGGRRMSTSSRRRTSAPPQHRAPTHRRAKNRNCALRIAPVATTIPPGKSGSVETMTSLLTEGLVARGHDVTLFATADSTTKAKLHAIYPHGYWHDENMWPWELYEMLNLAAAVERARDFDIIHYEAAYYPMSLAFARLSPTPIVQTLHHSPSTAEVALWSRYPGGAVRRHLERAGAPAQRPERRRDRAARHRHRQLRVPGDSPTTTCSSSAASRKARACCRRSRSPSASACASSSPPPRTTYYREHVAPHVDGSRVIYHGEADFPAKVKLYGGARALLYPIQAREPFGLVLAEAMACGTPVAALDRGAVREVVDEGVTGIVFKDLEAMANDLSRVFDLDRRRVRERAVVRFGIARMVDEYVTVYRRLVEAHRER